MTGPRNFRTIINGNFIRIEEEKGVNILLTAGLLGEDGGGGREETLSPT